MISSSATIPPRALFKAKEQWDAMRMGSLDMALFPLDYASGKVPQFLRQPDALRRAERGPGG